MWQQLLPHGQHRTRVSEPPPADVYVFWQLLVHQMNFLPVFPAMGTILLKSVNTFVFWGTVRTEHPLQGSLSLASRHFMLLAFELRPSPTTKACQNPQGKSGLSSLQKVGHVPGEGQARWPSFLTALERGSQIKMHLAVYCCFSSFL